MYSIFWNNNNWTCVGEQWEQLSKKTPTLSKLSSMKTLYKLNRRQSVERERERERKSEREVDGNDAVNITIRELEPERVQK